MMTVGALGITNPSLAAMISFCGIKIRRESLHGRFNAESVAFMESALDYVFKQKCRFQETIETKLLRHFRNVYIIDSSSWGVNPKLKDVFPGSGGSASKANCKIQICYEYLQGHISFFDLTEGILPDSKYSRNLPSRLRKNDLILFDLGYFCMETFFEIIKKKACFLSRFIYNTALYDPETLQRINLLETLRKSGNIYEANVLMGYNKTSRIACRFIAIRINEETANMRRCKQRRRAQKKGNKPSKQSLEMCNWTVMVTNISPDQLPVKMILALYSLRWQIELVFKQFKSQLNIDKIDTSNEHRCRCEIMGRIIMAILIHRVHAHLNYFAWTSRRKEVSMEKLYKRLGERAFRMINAIKNSFRSLLNYLNKELDYLLEFCLKGSQNNRRNILELLEFGPVDKYLIKSQILVN